MIIQVCFFSIKSFFIRIKAVIVKIIIGNTLNIGPENKEIMIVNPVMDSNPINVLKIFFDPGSR